MTRWIRPQLLFCLALSLAEPVRALELADSKWGFDGTMLPGRLNLVSFRLFNADTIPFDGTVSLERSGFGFSGASGALHEARIYVSPQTYRWVQFAVEPSGANENFVFRYPLTRERMETKTFNDLKVGLPARVLLINSGDTSAIPARMPAFPSDVFPANVTALDVLEQLALDQKPDWDAPRRQALLDWVRLGGVVHLLKDREGKIPLFDGELSVLNSTETLTRIGAGLVVRHAFSRRDATEKRLDDEGYPGSTWSKPNQGVSGAYETTQLLQELKSFIRPQHPWALISLLLFIYIGMVGPGQYFLVKKKNLDYRVSLLILIGLVSLFSVVFYQIGLRGYQNPSMVLSLSRATVLADGRVALTKWGQVFTRKGRETELKHAGPGGAYDLPGMNEKVPVTATNGAQASLSAQMPVNSTLPFVFRGVVPMEVCGMESIPGQSTGLRFTGKPPPGLSKGMLLRGDSVWELDVGADGLITTGSPHNLKEHLHPLLDNLRSHGWQTRDIPPNLSGFLETKEFRDHFLSTWLAGVVDRTVPIPPENEYQSVLQNPPWRNGVSDVFIAGSANPASHLQGNEFSFQPDITVYHWRLAGLPGSASP